ncbi:hypothetical protein Pmani_006342 [Petrolisthes manimaculis]|uniref:Uncharacterized protein n=1 Tax=Petrolisthes manimaculis TaxID=1843537 RepID=A0AAE1QA12_9EUCA|nr:hypothetical protein Pmani_006342 [Petrolisthes manimaculis]
MATNQRRSNYLPRTGRYTQPTNQPEGLRCWRSDWECGPLQPHPPQLLQTQPSPQPRAPMYPSPNKQMERVGRHLKCMHSGFKQDEDASRQVGVQGGGSMPGLGGAGGRLRRLSNEGAQREALLKRLIFWFL